MTKLENLTEEQEKKLRNFVIEILQEQMNEMEFEEFLQDTADIMFSLRDKIDKLEEKLEDK